MDPARYDRIQSLFLAAAELSGAQRLALLDDECAGDADLREAVLRMLAADARSGLVIDRDLASVARGVIGDEATPRPERFGPYRVTRLLGEGGMGVVYLAVRDDLGSYAAIKLLRDAWVSPARRDRFAAEQRVLALLNHPYIARLYDAGTLPDGTPWFVMEYVDGVPITEYCRSRVLPVAERLRLFRDVCEAAEHAHRQLVLHRDLKPTNILVTADGTVKLLDFGIAKQLEGQAAAVDLTRTGMRLMTPAYASPERLRGEPTGVAADVYSLGVILYELLTGRLPFDSAERASSDLGAAVPGHEPPPPSSVIGAQSPGWPAGRSARADLDVLTLTAMHGDLKRRYPSGEALVRDLDHFARGEPLEARPDTVRYRLGKLLRRRAREATAAALVLVAVLGLTVFYTARLARARNEAVANARRAQRIQRFILDLFEGGDPQAGPAYDLDVTTLVERGVQETQSLSAEPAVQADFYQTLGGIHQKLGNLEQSDELLGRALETRQATNGPSSPEVAAALIALGLLRADQARFDEAEQLVRDGLAMTRAHRPDGDPAVPRAMAALGHVLADRGRHDEAIAVLEEAVRLQETAAAEAAAAETAGAELGEQAGSLYELASAYFYAGDYDRSESLNQRALTLYMQVYGGKHPLVSDCLINLGAIQFERGAYAEAERLYRQGLEITQAWYGRDHYKTAANLTMLARTLNRTPEREAEARDLLQQALEIRERVYGPRHPNVASAVNELGTVALIAGRLDEAERYYSRVVDIYREVYGSSHYLLGLGLANLASVDAAGERWGRAEELLGEALAVYAGTLPPDHSNVGIARIKLGRALLRQHRYAEAAAETRAGYEALAGQMEPGVSWLVNARKDLIEAYEALARPEDADRFRAEQAALGN